MVFSQPLTRKSQRFSGKNKLLSLSLLCNSSGRLTFAMCRLNRIFVISVAVKQ